MKITSVLAWQ